MTFGETAAKRADFVSEASTEHLAWWVQNLVCRQRGSHWSPILGALLLTAIFLGSDSFEYMGQGMAGVR